MKKIDLETWDRREHFQFFRRSDYAHYHIGANLEITRFKEGCQVRGLPFSFAMTYIVTAVMNEVPAFCYRIQEGEVVLHERLHPYFSYLAPDRPYFKMVLAQLDDDLPAFAVRAREKALAQEAYFIQSDVMGRSDLLFISSIPNVSFTHLSHTISLTNKDDAIPRLSWGKYLQKHGRFTLPFNIQAHHAFVDGDHMGQYIDRVQARLNTCFL